MSMDQKIQKNVTLTSLQITLTSGCHKMHKQTEHETLQHSSPGSESGHLPLQGAQMANHSPTFQWDKTRPLDSPNLSMSLLVSHRPNTGNQGQAVLGSETQTRKGSTRQKPYARQTSSWPVIHEHVLRCLQRRKSWWPGGLDLFLCVDLLVDSLKADMSFDLSGWTHVTTCSMSFSGPSSFPGAIGDPRYFTAGVGASTE